MRSITTYLLLFIVNLSLGQNKSNYLGTLSLSDNTLISFKLNLIEYKGIVSGFSTTNIGSKDETKSQISGLYFKNDKSFQLQETRILETTSEAPLNTFCYINMNLSFKGILGRKRLEGSFTGNFLDSTKCAQGKVMLIEEGIIKRTAKIKKKIDNKYSKNINKKKVQQKKILKDGDNISLNWEDEKITILIWDSNMEDGDRIELKINSKIILHDFETRKKKKKIRINLQEGKNIIEIKATSLGSSPPNTSRIELVDFEKIYPITNQLRIGHSAIIEIIK